MTRPDFPRFARPTAELHCVGPPGPALVFPLVSSECARGWFEFGLEFKLVDVLMFGIVRVGPNSADSFRISPLPTTRLLEVWRVSGGSELGIGVGNWGRVFVE